MKTRLVCACIGVLIWVSAADAVLVAYEFQPTPADLGDLDHAVNYTWGLRWSPPDGEQVVAAKLEIENLTNWAVEPNILYIHLLDYARSGVTTFSDTRSGDWFAGQGILLATFTDTGTTDHHPAVDWSYDFSAQDLGSLNTCMSDGKFGFGFDPDCHYYNDGVKLTLLVDGMPEPAMLVLLGLPLPLCFGRKRITAS